MSATGGWIGVDLDGTLAHYDGWRGPEHIGAPVQAMVDRVKAWLDNGVEVRIFTARVWNDTNGEATAIIAAWLDANGLPPLAITCTKDYGMVELWDDRAVRVVANAGVPCCDGHKHASA